MNGFPNMSASGDAELYLPILKQKLTTTQRSIRIDIPHSADLVKIHAYIRTTDAVNAYEDIWLCANDETDISLYYRSYHYAGSSHSAFTVNTRVISQVNTGTQSAKIFSYVEITLFAPGAEDATKVFHATAYTPRSDGMWFWDSTVYYGRARPVSFINLTPLTNYFEVGCRILAYGLVFK